jgi:hypothetical protein
MVRPGTTCRLHDWHYRCLFQHCGRVGYWVVMTGTDYYLVLSGLQRYTCSDRLQARRSRPFPFLRPQALRTVRKDSFRKAANELNNKGSIVERMGGPDRVHEVISVGGRRTNAAGRLLLCPLQAWAGHMKRP